MTKPMKNTMKPAMNDKQMRTAKEICDMEGVDFHKAINHNMFW